MPGEYHDHKLSFRELARSTLAGVAGGILAHSFEGAGYLRTPLLEGIVRFTSGSMDSIGEGGYTAIKELSKYFRGLKNTGSPALYYVGGKLAGTLFLSWMPHYLFNRFGIDVHTPLGSIVTTFYAQGDQIGAFLGLLLYYTKKNGKIKDGIIETVRDPVAQTSLMVTGASWIIDTLVRIPWTPTTFKSDWLETWLLSPLCMLPVLRGRKEENKTKN